MGWQDAPEVPRWQDAPEVDESGRQLTQSEKVAKGGLSNIVNTLVDTGLVFGSSMIAEPLAGFAGVGKLITSGGDFDQAAASVESMRDRFTHKPMTEGSQAAMNAAADTVGKYGEFTDWAGGQVTDMTGSPAMGTAVKTGLDFAPAAIPVAGSAARRGKQLVSSRRQPPPVQKAAEMGYVLEPNQVIGGKHVGGTGKRAAAAVGGKSAVPAQASLENQLITNRLVAKEIGLPENSTMITKGDIARLRQKANNTYTKIKSSRTKMRVQNDPDYIQAIDDAIYDAKNHFTGKEPPGAVMKQLKEMRSPQSVQSVGGALDQVERLRSDARALFKSSKPKDLAMARANRAAADALEDAVGRALQQSAPNLLPEYQAARQQLAKLHNVSDAMKGGDIDATVLSKLRDNGAPLTGALADVADVADYFPHVMQTRATVGRLAGSGALDAMFGLHTMGGWPVLRTVAQPLAKVRPKAYKPEPFTNQLLAGELIGSQMSAYNDGNN